MKYPDKVLVVGATGSIGRLVVEEALRAGHTVRALVREGRQVDTLPTHVQCAVGDLAQPQTLVAAVDGVDAIVFTHGSSGDGKLGSERVDYGGVRNILAALQGTVVRVAMMTAIGVTDRKGDYNRATEAHDWKRRGERLLRASGLPYTIVRPGWFDYQAQDQHHLVMRQGDTHHAGNPSDGVVARRQIAQVLVSSLSSAAALCKTLELVAQHGTAQTDLQPLFAALQADTPGVLDACLDTLNMPLAQEPERVQADLRKFTRVRSPIIERTTP
jgi:uncharacterized protein YbjT (DUF2867 family)